MVPIDTIRKSNSECKVLEDLVVVFVGGTKGIGESTAKELFIRTTRPRAYIVGRDTGSGNRVVNELHELNPQGAATFVRCDISLLHNVDELCADLRAREPKINCLFLTAGYMTLHGRVETPEGLDRKMCVNYYARMRVALNLMPCITAASRAGELSRVISVLAAGSEADVRLDDLDLQHDFTLHACLAHCVMFTDFMVQELADRYPGTSFSHSYPGTVKTGIANELSGAVRLAVKVMYAVMASWIINIQESGERHLFQMTSRCYPSRNSDTGIPIPDGLSTMSGADGKIGSGAYLLDWDGKPTGDEAVLRKYNALDMRSRVWEHTTAMFSRAEQRMRRESKRAADQEAEGSGRTIPDPIGWRPAS